ncbi:hypothetical protein [Bogoriella caseilytica]|uniref:Uncharacterized protein n=1 Tax=Bogoriella caseilytica TaxID=56055 RepID=A0A3N2BGN6_9MICO|nr:hypothetical protein [Bogoriella caseilytica]ROR74423.1 hypothetical protein EDD31_2839 [Bogoriella caseilytica]
MIYVQYATDEKLVMDRAVAGAGMQGVEARPEGAGRMRLASWTNLDSRKEHRSQRGVVYDLELEAHEALLLRDWLTRWLDGLTPGQRREAEARV